MFKPSALINSLGKGGRWQSLWQSMSRHRQSVAQALNTRWPAWRGGILYGLAMLRRRWYWVGLAITLAATSVYMVTNDAVFRGMRELARVQVETEKPAGPPVRPGLLVDMDPSPAGSSTYPGGSGGGRGGDTPVSSAQPGTAPQTTAVDQAGETITAKAGTQTGSGPGTDTKAQAAAGIQRGNTTGKTAVRPGEATLQGAAGPSGTQSGTGTLPRGFLALPLDAKVSRPYGFNYSPTHADYRLHTGIDLPGAVGTAVMAAADGVVARVESGVAYRYRVTIEHPVGYTTRYAHLGRVDVAQGDQVKKGQVIGAVGEPGLDEVAEPPHLHFEVLAEGKPVDPAMALQ